jgi:hypothetical protein
MTVENLVSDEAKKDMMLFGRNEIASYRIMRDSPESDVGGFLSAMRDCYTRLTKHYKSGDLPESEMIKYSKRMNKMTNKISELEKP